MNKENRWMKLVSGSGLGLFRIAYGIVLLLEIWQMFEFRHLIFDPIPYLKMAQFSFAWLLGAWMFLAVLLIIGWNTFLVSIANYGLTVIIIGGLTTFEYHIDYVLTGINFLLIFIPVGACFSVDEYLKRNKYTPKKVAVGNYYILVLFGLALVYIDSIFWKLSSPMWVAGLGLWMPASLPQVSYINLEWLLNTEWLIRGLGYLTFIFEFLFIFLFIWSKARIPLLIIGLGLHLGISLVFPIPLFGLGVAAIYVLLIPLKFTDHLWLISQPLITKFRTFKPISLISHFTLFPKKEIKLHPHLVRGFIALTLLLQVSLIVNNSPLFHLRDHRLQVLDCVYDLSRRFWGITSHPVFMDHHFEEYEQLVGLTYLNEDNTEEWLPILNEDGTPGKYLRGRIWVHWTWRVNGPNSNDPKIEEGIQRFIAFWTHQNQIDLTESRFQIKLKQIEVPTAWSPNFLHEQKEKTWKNGKTMIWENGKIVSQLPQY